MLAQTPSCCSGPVSFDVGHQKDVDRGRVVVILTREDNVRDWRTPMRLIYLGGIGCCMYLYSFAPSVSANSQQVDGALVGGYERRHSVSMPLHSGNDVQKAIAVDYLRIRSFDGTTLDFCLDTTASNANMCNISGEASKVGESMYVFRDIAGSDACFVHFKITATEIAIEKASGPCHRRYCGAGAEFVGVLFSRRMKISNEQLCVGE